MTSKYVFCNSRVLYFNFILLSLSIICWVPLGFTQIKPYLDEKARWYENDCTSLKYEPKCDKVPCFVNATVGFISENEDGVSGFGYNTNITIELNCDILCMSYLLRTSSYTCWLSTDRSNIVFERPYDFNNVGFILGIAFGSTFAIIWIGFLILHVFFWFRFGNEYRCLTQKSLNDPNIRTFSVYEFEFPDGAMGIQIDKYHKENPLEEIKELSNIKIDEETGESSENREKKENM